MKHTLLILATFMCCAFSTREQPSAPQANGTVVYICTGPQSKRYHCTPRCRGLGSCSKEVIAVSLEKAKRMGRTPCGWCY